ncbi:MFS transporter [bacterium]|nr:MFS transporter [bacterium]
MSAESLTEPEAGAFETGRITTVAAGHAVHDTFTAFLPPLLPRLVESMSLSTTAAGGLTVFLAVPGLLQPVIGRLADTTSLRWMVVAAPGVTGTLMTLMGVGSSYWALAAILMMAGLSVAALHSVGPAVIGRLAGSSVGRGMGFWMVGGELGRTIGPIVVVSVVGVAGLNGLPVLAPFALLTSAILYWRLRGVPLAPPPRAADHPDWRVSLMRMRRVMTVLSGLVAMRALMTMAAVTYLPLYLTDQGVSLWFAGAALSILEAAGVVGAMAGGWVSDRIGRKAVLYAAHIISPLLLLTLVTVDGWMRVPVLLALGLALLSITPVSMALVQDQFPEDRAFANGVYLAMAFAIRSAAAIGVGLVADSFGLTVAFVGASVVMLVGVPIIALLPEESRTG